MAAGPRTHVSGRFLAALFALALPAAHAAADPAAWRVTTADGGDVTLLGSMHVLRPSDHPLPPVEQRAEIVEFAGSIDFGRWNPSAAPVEEEAVDADDPRPQRLDHRRDQRQVFRLAPPFDAEPRHHPIEQRRLEASGPASKQIRQCGRLTDHRQAAGQLCNVPMDRLRLAADTLLIDPTTLGQITLADFVNEAGLKPIGDNLFQETPASGEAVVGNPDEDNMGYLKQGYLESSNVDPVKEITELISAQRAYEMNSKVITTADEMASIVSKNLK